MYNNLPLVCIHSGNKSHRVLQLLLYHTHLQRRLLQPFLFKEAELFLSHMQAFLVPRTLVNEAVALCPNVLSCQETLRTKKLSCVFRPRGVAHTVRHSVLA